MQFPHLRHGQRVINMNRYMNAELADIHFIYGLANENGRVSVQLCGERYPIRRQSNHQTIARVHQNLAEHGSFRDRFGDTLVNSKMDMVA
ncbi:hypothetical protein TNCV_1124581 [Trichonephila clavipes]|uniref:Uncharacterized protein n=1 Tax=Trichonephila clavipes TaxID=2585209 RepID=A0A8X6SEV7_TRICX|nr:hypothetical protein TNCV_1124581 [Trichonephila clavipes]